MTAAEKQSFSQAVVDKLILHEEARPELCSLIENAYAKCSDNSGSSSLRSRQIVLEAVILFDNAVEVVPNMPALDDVAIVVSGTQTVAAAPEGETEIVAANNYPHRCHRLKPRPRPRPPRRAAR